MLKKLHVLIWRGNRQPKMLWVILLLCWTCFRWNCNFIFVSIWFLCEVYRSTKNKQKKTNRNWSLHHMTFLNFIQKCYTYFVLPKIVFFCFTISFLYFIFTVWIIMVNLILKQIFEKFSVFYSIIIKQVFNWYWCLFRFERHFSLKTKYINNKYRKIAFKN